MAKHGVYFNYRREYRYVWLSIAVITILSLVFMAASCFLYKKYQGDKICFAYYLVGETLIISAQTLPFLSYITLLRNLHERLGALNSLLRFWLFSHSHDFLHIFDILFLILIRNRKQFMLINIRKEDSINFVKFTGRQHSFLTGIMDQINFCYSFQVRYCLLSSFNRLNNVDLFFFDSR